MKCEICNRKATWIVFRGICEERENTGPPVCRKHALEDKTLTAIEPIKGVTTMKYLLHYNADAGIPDRDEFLEYSLAELLDEDFAANFREPEAGEDNDWDEWVRNSFALDQEGYRKALEAARAGKIVLVAQDDDGYYFATK